MPVEVEAVLLGLAQLHQVVIQRFLADFDFFRSIFKRLLDVDTVFVSVADVHQAPESHATDHIQDCALLDARRLLLGLSRAVS